MANKVTGESHEEATFDAICKEIHESKGLTDEHKTRLTRIFGSRFAAAYKAVEEKKAKKYVFQPSGRAIWVVTGKERDYQILPSANFCSCFDFYFRVIGHETSLCYHIIAKKLAEALDKYDTIEEPDSNFISIMENLRKIPKQTKTLSAEEMENIRRVAKGILLEEKQLPINGLLKEVKEAGFVNLTATHLSNILKSDKTKRFKYSEDVWHLAP